MAVKLGYGGLANTNGARDFSGKEELVVTYEQSFTRRLRRWSRILVPFLPLPWGAPFS